MFGELQQESTVLLSNIHVDLDAALKEQTYLNSTNVVPLLRDLRRSLLSAKLSSWPFPNGAKIF